ncbi:MAG: helix-turn-helix domain-containing protein [Patescibacteria group bacterium]
MSYKHINSQDRIVIDTLLSENRTKAYIARRLGIDRSSIGREIIRGSKPKPKNTKHVVRPKIIDMDGRKLRGSGFTKTKYEALDVCNKAVANRASKQKYYYAGLAGKRTKKRRKLANQLRIRIVQGSGSFLETYVLDNLKHEQWSPEQIAGRLLEHHAVHISPQTIYDYIYASSDKKSSLNTYGTRVDGIAASMAPSSGLRITRIISHLFTIESR